MSALNLGVPEAQPLVTLEDVFNWNPVQDDLTVPTVSLKPRTSRKENMPKTLACHDMKGGYQEDRFIQGFPQDDVYRFFHWSLVDVFVYFSHKFVTLPPPGWIDSGHLHGVQVLGLCITEGKDGESICREFLQSRESYMKFVKKLIEIAIHYRFDGWFINIENPVHPEQVGNLVNFLGELKKGMHAVNNESLVIWYDSVIDTGELDWQNELNLKNKMFFDACDGIFINYFWNEENLKHTVANSYNRKTDIYVGVDVFGRSMLGGGGFNTSTALSLVRKSGLSAAIFAFGWVHEKLPKEDFTQNEYKFWSTLSDFCPSHGPKSLPFGTSFCQGFGQNFYYRGKLMDNQPWTNLSLQNFQPTSQSAYQNSKLPYKLSIHTEKPYCGGGSLHLSGVYHGRIIPTFQLFTSSFSFEEPVFISYTWFPVLPSDVDICLQLALRENDGTQKVVHLQKCFSFDSNENENEFLSHCSSIDPNETEGDSRVKSEWKFPVNIDDINFHNLHSVHLPLESEEGWKTRGYILHPNENDEAETIERIAVEIMIENRTENQEFEVLLGNLQIIPFSYLLKPKESFEVYCDHIETVREHDFMIVTSLLLWEREFSDLLDHYSIYCQLEWDQKKETVFIGSTRKNMFKVTHLKLSDPGHGPYNLRFIIQEKLFALKTLDLYNSPSIVIPFG